MNIRWMIRADLPQVLAIEEACYGDPWSEVDFVGKLSMRDAIGLVVEVQDTVCGYCVHTLQKDHLEILNLAIDPMVARRGYGAALLEKVAGKLNQKRNRVTALVPERNLDALLFLKACGFLAESIEREPYEDRDDDGIWMVYRARVPDVA